MCWKTFLGGSFQEQQRPSHRNGLRGILRQWSHQLVWECENQVGNSSLPCNLLWMWVMNLKRSNYQWLTDKSVCKLSPRYSFRSAGLAQCQSARLPPMWRGFDSRTRRHMWAEFVGSLLCSERFFSGYSGFPLSSKNQNLIWFDLCWVKLIWFHLLWFIKGIPPIGITSGISCSWYWTNKVLLLSLLPLEVPCGGLSWATAHFIDLFHNGGQIKYSFVLMLISLTRLATMCKIQRKFCS